MYILLVMSPMTFLPNPEKRRLSSYQSYLSSIDEEGLVCPGNGMEEKMAGVSVVWFRNDLRVHDNEALVKATQRSGQVVPVYCFDPRLFMETSFGFEKTGGFRARFLLESLASLRRSLQELGGDLLLLEGHPEEVLPPLCRRLEAEALFYAAEVTDEETRVERRLEHALEQVPVSCEAVWGSTLYHIDDLPMPVMATPDVFTLFRKRVEKDATPREVLATPARLEVPPLDEWGALPTLETLGVKPRKIDSRTVLPFKGGEEEGLLRLEHYFWNSRCLKDYKETRNGLLGADYSSKFSPWLAHGCLSPREIDRQVKLFEAEVTKNKSTYWLIFELIWRDFFRFIAKKEGNSLFHFEPRERFATPTPRDWERFDAWAQGRTGVPFIDANMTELNETGFMSNRGRQNVGSFLVKDLCVPWVLGAAYFESLLLDYDVCSNWGNWRYVAGVGNDPREDRYFNVLGQGLRYDAKGDYVRHWLPALKPLDDKWAHMPFFLPPRSHEASLVTSYPAPVVLPRAFRKFQHQP